MSDVFANRMAQSLAHAIELLEKLIAFDTESSKSNLPLIHFVADYLQARDIPSVIVPNSTGDKAALFATIGPMRDAGILLSGHTDVVPVTGQTWTSDPFTLQRRGTRLYGRGTCDMKGFCALALAMMDEYRDQPLHTPIHLLLSYDEETTCLGPIDTIERFGLDLPRPRAVIVGEPTLMQVADAHKSVTTYITNVRGHEAHSSQPALGINAIEGACDLVSELYRMAGGFASASDLDQRFDPPYSTLSVGTIQGGTARNILARDCEFHWEFRALPNVERDRVERALEAYAHSVVVPRLQRGEGIACVTTVTEVEVPGLRPEPGSVAESLALKLAHANHTVAVSYATEAGRFQAAGIPTVVCGPGSIAQAHQPDEFIEISQMEAGLSFLRDLAQELMSGKPQKP